MMRIGFVGMGATAGPIVPDLMAAGRDLAAHDIRPEATATLAAHMLAPARAHGRHRIARHGDEP
ncbi:MAG: hypothetical protein KF889_05585 [Alphaproteobacteria bacterium]|nr:hypothetical protein [Alphaproteobacteria bacterium]MCW5742342.1 hypothetical protein [Alphaproteobacteria bacterium]